MWYKHVSALSEVGLIQQESNLKAVWGDWWVGGCTLHLLAHPTQWKFVVLWVSRVPIPPAPVHTSRVLLTECGPSTGGTRVHSAQRVLPMDGSQQIKANENWSFMAPVKVAKTI